MPGSTFGFVPNVFVVTDKVESDFSCTAAEQVGDLVRLSDVLDNTVERLTSNSYDGLVVGVVVNKANATTATVRQVGRISTATGLLPGLPVLVASDGTPTTTVPTAPYHHQILGTALSATEFLLLPQTQKVIRS